MTPNPMPMAHRLLALSLLVLLLGSAYLLVDQTWMRQYRLYQDHSERLLNRLYHLQRLVATRPELEQAIQSISADPRTASYFLPHAPPTIAAADLQQRIKSLVESSGGSVSSIQALPVTEENGVLKVAVSVSTQGDVAALQRALHTLEAQTPLLFVDNLDIYARAFRPRQPDGRLATNPQIQLSSQFEVIGYLRKEGD